jgi:predicted deacetylase
MKTYEKIIVFSLTLIILLAVIILLVRANSGIGLDDVSPGIQCDKGLLEKSDVFYVIPKFENASIAENKEWCEKIKSMNKTLALHGVYHTYKEFNTSRDEKYLQEGIDIFKECFGFEPESFKPPQMLISSGNKNLIKSKMRLDYHLNSILHKAYHCNDTGAFSNRFMDII